MARARDEQLNWEALHDFALITIKITSKARLTTADKSILETAKTDLKTLRNSALELLIVIEDRLEPRLKKVTK